MENNSNKLDKFIAIVVGKKEGSKKQNEQLEKYRFAFSLASNGYTPLQISKIVAEKFGMSQSSAWRLLRESKEIFGDASQSSKRGEQYAMYEFFMRMAKKASAKGDFATARLCAVDAAKILGLDKEDFSGLFDPSDFMRPDLFVISHDPKHLDVVNRTIEIQDVDFEEMQEEKSEEDAQG